MPPERQVNAAQGIIGLILLIGTGGLIVPAAYGLLGLGDTLLGVPLPLIGAAGVLYLGVGLVLIWLTRERRPAPPTRPPMAVPAPPAATSSDAAPPPRRHGDDLTQIEGIGLKCQAVLYAAGITTYTQLAQTPVSTLERIVTVEHRIMVLDGLIATWPEQAAYAARGDQEGLETLQARLRRHQE